MVPRRFTDDNDSVTNYYLAVSSAPEAVEWQGLPATITLLGLSWSPRRSSVETRLIAELLLALPRASGTLAICRHSGVRARDFSSLASRELSVILPATPGRLWGLCRKAPVFAVRGDQRMSFVHLLEKFWCVGAGHWLFVDWRERDAEILQRIDALRSESSHARMQEKGLSLLAMSSYFGITYDDIMVNLYVRASPDEVYELMTKVADQCGVTLACEEQKRGRS